MEESCWQLGGVTETMSSLSPTPLLSSSHYPSPTSWDCSSKPSTTAASTPSCGGPLQGTQDFPLICLMQKCPLETFPSRTARRCPSFSTNGWPAMPLIFTPSKDLRATLLAQTEWSCQDCDVWFCVRLARCVLLIDVTFCGSDWMQQSLFKPSPIYTANSPHSPYTVNQNTSCT